MRDSSKPRLLPCRDAAPPQVWLFAGSAIFHRRAPRDPAGNSRPPDCTSSRDPAARGRGVSAGVFRQLLRRATLAGKVVGPHPLVRGVARAHVGRQEGAPLTSTGAGGAVHEGRRWFTWTMHRAGAWSSSRSAPTESNPTSAPAFPVLMGYATDWLVRCEVNRLPARPLVQQARR